MVEGINYTVLKSRRKTISITVQQERVIVRAPIGMNDERINGFVKEHAAWIRKKLAEYNGAANRFAGVRVEKPLVLGSKGNFEKDGVVYLKELKSAQNFFKKMRSFLLVEKTALLARTVGGCPEDVSVRDFKARWGCCDANKRIRLNWRLSMLPPDLQDYVLVHELCHLKHMNHSSAFWAEVKKILPDYASRKKRLKEYAFLTLLYR